MKRIIPFLFLALLYLSIPSSLKDEANQWVRDNLDHGAGDTFIENKQNDQGEKFCLISLPDNDSRYTLGMIEQFGLTPDAVVDGLVDIPDEGGV